MTKARICIVDDDHPLREALARGLREAGYDVLVAPGGAAGLDLVSRYGADAIVTDMKMPGTDGAELISQVRAQWPATPIVAISGEVAIDGRIPSDIARERGASVTLAKPFRTSELSALLEQLLARRP